MILQYGCLQVKVLVINLSSRETVIAVMIGVRYFFCLLQGAKHLLCSTSLASRRKRIHQHFDDLERCYFSIRQGDLPSKCVGVLNFNVSMMLLRIQTNCAFQWQINPCSLDIKMAILLTVLHVFPIVLVQRIFFQKLRHLNLADHFLYSHNFHVWLSTVVILFKGERRCWLLLGLKGL